MSERIATRCPACHSSTLVIGDGNWLVCSLIGCPDPTRINSVGDRADSHFNDLQTLRDERDRLRGALEEIAGNLAGSPKRKLMLADDDFWATPGEHTLRQWLAQAALTPAAGGTRHGTN